MKHAAGRVARVDATRDATDTCTGKLTKWRCTLTTTSYSKARENLASLWDEVEDTREEVILRRRGHEDIALLPAQELRSLQETAHLLRSPANAIRLLRALARSRKGVAGPEFDSIDDLAAALGLSG